MRRRVDSGVVKEVSKFYNTGDMLESEGGAERAVSQSGSSMEKMEGII